MNSFSCLVALLMSLVSCRIRSIVHSNLDILLGGLCSRSHTKLKRVAAGRNSVQHRTFQERKLKNIGCLRACHHGEIILCGSWLCPDSSSGSWLCSARPMAYAMDTARLAPSSSALLLAATRSNKKTGNARFKAGNPAAALAFYHAAAFSVQGSGLIYAPSPPAKPETLTTLLYQVCGSPCVLPHVAAPCFLSAVCVTPLTHLSGPPERSPLPPSAFPLLPCCRRSSLCST
jgi:hypothetical protein